MKANFQTVLVTDECRATLNGPNEWRRGWFCREGPRPHEGGGGVMFWARIVGDELIGPFRVAEGVKMTAKFYIDFLKEHLVPWHKKRTLTFRKNMVFMNDNAPSHAARLTTEYLERTLPDIGKPRNRQPALQI